MTSGGAFSQQLLTFGQSILLGISVGVLYDLLRPFRLLLPRVAPLLDGAFCAAVGSVSFLFLLRRGSGELRGFLVVGALGGAVLFFCAFSAWLRPVWAFWANTLQWTAERLLRPARRLKSFCKKTVRQGKNLFYFARKCYTIRRTKWGRRRHAWQKGPKSGETQKRAWRQSL